VIKRGPGNKAFPRPHTPYLLKSRVRGLRVFIVSVIEGAIVLARARRDRRLIARQSEVLKEDLKETLGALNLAVFWRYQQTDRLVCLLPMRSPMTRPATRIIVAALLATGCTSTARAAPALSAVARACGTSDQAACRFTRRFVNT